MTDITLDTITSGYNLSKVNNNFQTIQTVVNDETLHTTGGNNQLNQDIDVNSQRLYNVPDATEDSHAVNYSQLIGAVSNTSIVEETIQQVLTEQVFSNFNSSTFTAGTDFTDGVTVQFTLETSPGSKDNIWIYFDGTYQEKGDFELSGNLVTLDTAPSGVTTVEMVYGQALPDRLNARDVTEQSSSFTLDESMAYQYIRIVGATAYTLITIPSDPSDDIPISSEFHVRLQSNIACEIVYPGVVTVNAPFGGTLELSGEGATVTIKKVANQEWDVMGQVIDA